MKSNPQQLSEQFACCPAEQKEYEIDGQIYKVTRHFTGDKNINQVIYSLAETCADRDAGLI